MTLERNVLNERYLLEACKNGDVQTFKQCLEHNVSLHEEHAHFKDTAIFHCCYNGHISLLKCFLEKEPNILFQPVVGKIGECPLLEHAQVWLQLQNTVNEGNVLLIGSFLFYMACIMQEITIVKFLALKMTSSTVSPVLQSPTLKQPFYIACTNNDIDIARFLLEMNMVRITQDIAEEFPGIVNDLLHSFSYVKPCSSIKTSKKRKTTSVLKRATTKTTAARKSTIRVKEPVKDKVMVSWDGLSLHTVKKNWIQALQGGGKDISNIDISVNSITVLPADFFTSVPNLEELNVSRNFLHEIPSEGLHSVKLINLIASQNQLTHLPVELFWNRTIQYLDVSSNSIDQLPSALPSNKDEFKKQVWKCTSLETFKCSKNLLHDLPKTMKGATGLLNLHLSRNRFSDFEFVWKCPLTLLDLSYNQLKQFSGMVDNVWSRTLQKLVLSHNNMTFVPASICQLQNLQKLNLSYNSLATLPHPNIWKCKMLSYLNLSYNELSNSKLSEGFMDVATGELEFDRTCELPVKLFSRSLQSLNLSNNRLDEVPASICQLKLLFELDLSNNTDLHHLPSSLGLLNNIWNLCLTNLDITNIPFRLDDYNHAVKVLPFLRAKFRKSAPFNRMKLMVVGLQGRGKTSLVAAIQEKPSPDDISTVGISIEQFALPMKSSLSIDVLWAASPDPEIIFSTWDLAGQQVYYATHQCFLTSNTLYLVVFNITHGNEGIESLKPWLLNIQARAPNSQCIIVGTHTDCLPKDYKQSAIKKYRNDIINKYKKKGYPQISGYVFVSSVTRENVDELRNTIYTTANAMIKKSSTESDYGKTAPLSYLQLYDRIIEETHQRRMNRTPPVLTTEEMLKLAQENPDNDIFEGEELCSAARFLHENGILLHFDDPLRGLSTLFFIDPSWLIDMLALVVTVKERNPYPFIDEGYIDKEKMMLILRDPRLPVTFIPQYLRLLERFEIALSIDNARFLIPCMLPIERPDIRNEMQHVITDEEIDNGRISNDRNSKYLTRNYHMNYIPAGFWSRLIARLVIAVQEWDSHVTASSKQQRRSCSFTVWKEGVFVMYEDGYFLIEFFFDDMIDYIDQNLSKQGMAITVWSKTQNFKVMGFIVDHVDMLLADWYPGLAEGVNEFQRKLIQRTISCPVCSLHLQQSIVSQSTLNADYLRNNFGSLFRDPSTVRQFSLPMCATATIEHQAILCDKHPDQPVPLELIIPDVVLTDIPKEYTIEQEHFDFDPREENRLGSGGAAKVYKATYKGRKVAVKQFHSQPIKNRRSHSKSLQVFTPDHNCEYEDECRVIKGVWELRQEVLVLCTLQHPNVIQFLGVCRSPLCFVIELAPMGSLQDVIDKLVKQRRLNNLEISMKDSEWFPSIFEKRITRNIALQVVEAIKYLHSFEIIYRDLKSDNLLVWSLNEEDTVNVKISDYGIAAYATPQGVVGDVGTPGFQAPEMKYGSPYDEKVDIFSYGMWLYQLMTGYSPYHEYSSPTEIKKALLSGIRPNIQKDCFRTKIPNMELLMQNCWHHSPMMRPSASDISTFLTHSDSCMTESIYPPPSSTDASMHNVTCFTLWNVQHREDLDACESMLLWLGGGDERKYEVLDFTDDCVRYEGLVAGPRVLFACQVEENVWLVTQEKEIEVFGRFNSQLPKILWKFGDLEDEIIMLSTHKTENFLNVFACAANGTLNVFKKFLNGTKAISKPLFDATEDEILSFEKDCWANYQVIKLNNIGAPSKCMTVTKNDTELWVGSGAMIVIVNLENDLQHISGRLKSSSSNAIVSCMVSDEKHYVWVCNWRSTYIVKWDVGTRTQVCEYQCNVTHPLNKVLYADVGSSCSAFQQRAASFDDSVFSTHGVQTTKSYFQKEGNDMERNNDTKSADNNNNNNNISKRANSFFQFPNRAMKRTWRSKSANLNNETTGVQHQDTSLVSTFARRIKTLRYVNGTLWVARAIGDILILNTDTEADFAGEAHVLTVLVDDNLYLMSGYIRSVHSVVATETKMVVLMRKNARCRQRSVRDRSFSETSNEGNTTNDTFQLIAYDVWEPEKIVEFNRNTREMCNSC